MQFASDSDSKLEELWFFVNGFEHFLKSWTAHSQIVFPISQETVYLGLKSTASYVNVLRPTTGGRQEVSRQKIKHTFNLISFSVKNQKTEFHWEVKKDKKLNKNKRNKI